MKPTLWSLSDISHLHGLAQKESIVNKLSYFTIALAFSLVSTNALACVGRISDDEKQALVKKLEQNLIQEKLDGAVPNAAEMLNEDVDVGTRGNCSAVTISLVQKITFNSDSATCTAFAASELREGYPHEENNMKHILSVVSCD